MTQMVIVVLKGASANSFHTTKAHSAPANNPMTERVRIHSALWRWVCYNRGGSVTSQVAFLNKHALSISDKSGDAQTKSFTMFRTALHFDVTLDVFDRAGKSLARSRVSGREVSGGSILSAEKDAQRWFAEKVYELLRDTNVTTPAPATKGAENPRPPDS
jgi:hypothetical protein